MANSKKKRLYQRKIVWVLAVIVAFVFLNNSSFLTRQAWHADERPLLLAHRGLAQTFPMEGITGETNTARRIYEPEHPYLENTIPSMEAAFLAGADIVELDVQRTKDGQLAVFHDAELGYRTEAKGSVKDYTMQELKTLDAGYGYTADQGVTYPFRGKGIGLIPSLDEVLSHFPAPVMPTLVAQIAPVKPMKAVQLIDWPGSVSMAEMNRLPYLTKSSPICG